MLHILDVNTVFVTLWGYQMSYIEFFGTIFNLWCVWLVAKNKVLNWPIGIVGILLFGVLYWQIRLYSDLLEQGYFLITSFWGWWVWLHPKTGSETDRGTGELTISRLSVRGWAVYVPAIILCTAVLMYLTAHLNVWWPVYFPEPPSYLFLDAFTTILSFAATVLMVRRQVDCWYLWITVDVLDLWVYWGKDVKLVAVLYFIFLVMATKGLLNWLAERRSYALDART